MIKELNKIDPYYLEGCPSVVKDYVKQLEGIVEEYLVCEQSITEQVGNIPRFRISPEGWDVLTMDSLVNGNSHINNTVFLEALIRMPSLFHPNRGKYDYNKVLIMMFVSSFDTFRREFLYKFLKELGLTTIRITKCFKELVDLGYIDYNLIGRQKSMMVKHYFITQEGKKSLINFIADIYSKPIKINFYDKNFKWDIRPAQGLRGAKQDLSERYDTIFGFSVPKRPKGEKPWLRDRSRPRPKKRVKSKGGR